MGVVVAVVIYVKVVELHAMAAAIVREVTAVVMCHIFSVDCSINSSISSVGRNRGNSRSRGISSNGSGGNRSLL